MSMKNGFEWGIDLDNDSHDIAVATRGDGRPSTRAGRDGRRKPRPAARVGGMHCRRNKRWTWGHGQAARFTDVMAFARCVAFLVALASSTAMANGFTWVNVGDPGNPANPASQSSSFGSVGYAFRISAFETTNAQYAAFLNEADPNGLNPNSIYSTLMGSDVNGGITDTGSPGSVYAVKPGFENKPVNFVSWNSAARFANWLTTGGTSTETGSYDMTDLARGRLPTARYVLPSFNEYYKASFYSGVGDIYTLYQTNFDSPVPTASGVASINANTAIYGGAGASPAATGPLDVGSFTNTLSAYGLFDALGNVTEYTDTIDPLNVSMRARVGGNWKMDAALLTDVIATSPVIYGGMGNSSDDSLGFRIAAVPEPGTISLAIMGGVALLGAGTMKRRRPAAGADAAAWLD